MKDWVIREIIRFRYLDSEKPGYFRRSARRGETMKRTARKILWCLVFSLMVSPFAPKLSHGLEANIETPSLPSEYLRVIERILPSRSEDLFVQLKNGLTVLIREVHSSKVVSTQVLVNTGSIHEDQYLNGGLSHYLEHIVSGGTTSRFSEEEAKEILQSMGGASNASTSYDRTVYYINTTSSHYKTALTLLISYVTEAKIAVPEFKREKPVIQQEMKLGENNPGRQLWKIFMKTAYQIHPIRHPIIGYEDVFVEIGRDQLYDYYKNRYVPQNMVVTIVGDVDAEDALGEVIRLAGTLKREFERPIYIPEEPPQVGPRLVEKQFPAARITSMTIGFPSVTLKEPDLYPLDVLAIILGDGRSSRLYRRLRDKDKLVLSVDTFNWTPSFARGVFAVTMSLEEAKRERAMESLWEEIEILQNRSVNKKELDKAKRNVVANHIFSNQSASGIASSLATSYVATGDPYFDEQYVKEIQKVTRRDVLRVARRYLRSSRTTVAVIMPPQETPRESTPMASGETRDSGIEKRVLPNGMTLLTKIDKTVPIVSFQLFGKGGLRFEPPGKPGLSRFTFSLLTKGTKKRSKIDIAQAMEEIGGKISSGSGRNTFFVSVSVLKEDFQKGLDTLADVVTHPSFPEEEIEKQRRDTLLAISRIDESWEREVHRLFLKQYYGDHPYGNDVIGTQTAVESLTREEIVAFYENLVMSNNAVLAIFGDIDQRDLEKKVISAFRDLKPGRLEASPQKDKRPWIVRDDQVEKQTDKVSAAIFVGYNGMDLFDEDRPAMDVIDAILSGIDYPSGRLHESLRGGTTSLVYYVHAFPSYGIDTGHFGVITQTTMGNYKRVLDLILEKMRQIQTEPVTDEELERGKNMVITMHELGAETSASQAYQAALWEAVGIGFDWEERYPDLVRRVNREDVLRVARKYLQYHLIVSTIPREPIEAVIPSERQEIKHVR
jgi:zinc protease